MQLASRQIRERFPHASSMNGSPAGSSRVRDPCARARRRRIVVGTGQQQQQQARAGSRVCRPAKPPPDWARPFHSCQLPCMSAGTVPACPVRGCPTTQLLLPSRAWWWWWWPLALPCARVSSRPDAHPHKMSDWTPRARAIYRVRVDIGRCPCRHRHAGRCRLRSGIGRWKPEASIASVLAWKGKAARALFRSPSPTRSNARVRPGRPACSFQVGGPSHQLWPLPAAPAPAPARPRRLPLPVRVRPVLIKQERLAFFFSASHSPQSHHCRLRFAAAFIDLHEHHVQYLSSSYRISLRWSLRLRCQHASSPPPPNDDDSYEKE